jgi:hypothetical protein
VIIKSLLNDFDGVTTELVGVFLLRRGELKRLPIIPHVLEDLLVGVLFLSSVSDFLKSVLVSGGSEDHELVQVLVTGQVTTIKLLHNPSDVTVFKTIGAQGTDDGQVVFEVLNFNLDSV